MSTRIAAWWRAWRSQAALGELDPRTLRDVGLAELAYRIEERQRSEVRLAMIAWRTLG